MNVYAIIPVKTFTTSKKRLSKVLNAEEREKLSEAMLYDVLGSACNCRSLSRVIVVSRDEHVLSIAREFGVSIILEKEENGVNAAVALTDGICRDADASIVIPQDLPLILPQDIEMVCGSAKQKRCVIVTPSHRYDGTNALLRKPPDVIRTHYDEDSYEIHVLKARQQHVPVRILMNRRLMLDLDEPTDMVKIMEDASTGRTVPYLREIRKRLKL